MRWPGSGAPAAEVFFGGTPATRIVREVECATAGVVDGRQMVEAPCPRTNGSVAHCAAECNKDQRCTSFQLGTAAVGSDTNCVVWRDGACDGPGGHNSTDPAAFGTAAGASPGALYRKVDGGEGSLPVATPSNAASVKDGTVCFAKCDTAWCNGHGSASFGSDGSCVCTCFSDLGWVGQRCDECGGAQPFFPIRADGEVVSCTLCTNEEHCAGQAQNVTANRAGCDCDCVLGYSGEDCNACAAGYNRSGSGDCQQRQRRCVVRPSRGDPLGAHVSCPVHETVVTGTNCRWRREEGYTCVSAGSAVCIDGTWSKESPYCQAACHGRSETNCSTHDWCSLVRTADQIGCTTNWCHYRQQMDTLIVTSLAIIYFVAWNYQLYRVRFSAPVYCVAYTWFGVVLDTLAACMIVADVGLDVSSCVEAARYDAMQGRHTRSTAMIVMLVVPYVLRVGIVCLEAVRDRAQCREVAKRIAVAMVIGPLEDMRQTVHIVMAISRDGVETDLNVHLRKRLALLGMAELFESVPQLVIQYFFIAELRSSRGYLALDNSSYFFIFASPCISVAMIVKGITGWAAITRGRTVARRAAAEAGAQRSDGTDRMVAAPYLCDALVRVSRGRVY
eukprot:gene19325-biopygen43584